MTYVPFLIGTAMLLTGHIGWHAKCKINNAWADMKNWGEAQTMRALDAIRTLIQQVLKQIGKLLDSLGLSGAASAVQSLANSFGEELTKGGGAVSQLVSLAMNAVVIFMAYKLLRGVAENSPTVYRAFMF